MIKFYHMQNLPETTASETGEKIYEWEYQTHDNIITEDGITRIDPVAKDSIDMYEKIQSGYRISDYKSRIEQGVEIGNSDGGIYLDTTQFGSSYDDINSYLDGLRQRIDALKTADTKSNAPDAEGGEIVKKSGTVAKEIATKEQEGGQE